MGSFTPNKLQRDVVKSVLAPLPSFDSASYLTEANIDTTTRRWLIDTKFVLEEIVAIANDTLASGNSYDELAKALIARLRQTSAHVRELIASCYLDQLIGPNAIGSPDLKKRLERVRDELLQGL